jgi:excisionase family DNA binding protein
VKANGDMSAAVDRLLTVQELAEFLRLTPKGVYAMVEARRIPFIRVSNRVRFRQSDVLAWLEENRVPSVERPR